MTKLLISLFVFLQAVISIRPGFVDLVDGKSNVHKYEHVSAGKTIQTGPQSRVEIGLGLDSLLRLDEDSAAVLESVDPADVSVRIEGGSALLEISKLDKPNQIHVTMGNIRALIDSKGVFHFSPNGIAVTDGKLKIESGSLTVQKGWQVNSVGSDCRQTKIALVTP